MSTPEYLIVTQQELAGSLCRIVEAEIASAVAERGVCTVALPGGSVAEMLFPLLRSAVIPWQKVQLFWSDERAVPATDSDSNFRLADELLLRHIEIPPQNVHPMLGSPHTLQDDAHSYEMELQSMLGDELRFDLAIMGMGPDGHVCSLFPNHPLLDDRHSGVAPVFDSPKPPPHRMTLTLPVLLGARRVLVGASGSSKAKAVADAGQLDCRTPLARLLREGRRVTLLLDAEAGSLLK